MIYNIMLVSGIQHSDSVIHRYTYICIYILFQIAFPYRLGYYKILSVLSVVKLINHFKM